MYFCRGYTRVQLKDFVPGPQCCYAVEQFLILGVQPVPPMIQLPGNYHSAESFLSRTCRLREIDSALQYPNNKIAVLSMQDNLQAWIRICQVAILPTPRANMDQLLPHFLAMSRQIKQLRRFIPLPNLSLNTFLRVKKRSLNSCAAGGWQNIISSRVHRLFFLAQLPKPYLRAIHEH